MLVYILHQREIYSFIYKDIYMFKITDKVRSLKYKTKDHNNQILWTKQLDRKHEPSFLYFFCISSKIACGSSNSFGLDISCLTSPLKLTERDWTINLLRSRKNREEKRPLVKISMVDHKWKYNELVSLCLESSHGRSDNRLRCVLS